MTSLLQWLAVDLRTGGILADLPDLDVESVSSVLCAVSTTMASLPVPTAPENWLRATLPGAVAMVLVDDAQDGTTPVPLWGGMATQRQRGAGDVVSLALATVEAYLDRRYLGDAAFTATDQNTIVHDLVTSFVLDGTFPMVVSASASATTRDRAYLGTDDKTVLTALTELAGVAGGPEWTVTWEWLHAPERIVPVLQVADRIGSAVPAGLGPSATFEVPGPVTLADLVEDFSAGKGATSVMATSTGTGATRPQSPVQTSGDTQRPTFEFRWTPSTSISDTATLTAHAQQTLAVLADGSQALSLSANLNDAPRLGRDWWIGDDIGYRVGGIDSAGVDTVPAFPGGISGTARAVGWKMTLTGVRTVTPILAASGSF